MSEYIINANNIYITLKSGLSDFEKEANIIDAAKCHLVNYGDLNDFDYPGVDIYETGYGYELYYDGCAVRIQVEDKMIVDYDFN